MSLATLVDLGSTVEEVGAYLRQGTEEAAEAEVAVAQGRWSALGPGLLLAPFAEREKGQKTLRWRREKRIE